MKSELLLAEKVSAMVGENMMKTLILIIVSAATVTAQCSRCNLPGPLPCASAGLAPRGFSCGALPGFSQLASCLAPALQAPLLPACALQAPLLPACGLPAPKLQKRKQLVFVPALIETVIEPEVDVLNFNAVPNFPVALPPRRACGAARCPNLRPCGLASPLAAPACSPAPLATNCQTTSLPCAASACAGGPNCGLLPSQCSQGPACPAPCPAACPAAAPLANCPLPAPCSSAVSPTCSSACAAPLPAPCASPCQAPCAQNAFPCGSAASPYLVF